MPLNVSSKEPTDIPMCTAANAKQTNVPFLVNVFIEFSNLKYILFYFKQKYWLQNSYLNKSIWIITASLNNWRLYGWDCCKSSVKYFVASFSNTHTPKIIANIINNAQVAK